MEFEQFLIRQERKNHPAHPEFTSDHDHGAYYAPKMELFRWNNGIYEVPETTVCHRCGSKMKIGARTTIYRGEQRTYPTYRCLRKACQTYRSVKNEVKFRNIPWRNYDEKDGKMKNFVPQMKREMAKVTTNYEDYKLQTSTVEKLRDKILESRKSTLMAHQQFSTEILDIPVEEYDPYHDNNNDNDEPPILERQYTNEEQKPEISLQKYNF